MLNEGSIESISYEFTTRRNLACVSRYAGRLVFGGAPAEL